MFSVKLCLILFVSLDVSQINSQSGPDPWNYESKPPVISNEFKIPPDIRMPLKPKIQTSNKLEKGEWFFKRVLAIFLKGGQTQKNEDGSVDISLQMKFDREQWKTLDDCLKSENPLSEDILRRTIGYVQDSINKPTITETIVMAWSDYVQIYLTEYKTYITWALGFLAAAGGLLWLWSRMSHKHIMIIVFIILYAYEVIISYKEAEQKELEKFLSAVDHCKWFFWKSTCEVPPPDLLVFMKYMNPSRIAMRMFTTVLAEPIVAISGTVEIILHGVTDGLWYPFSKIAYGILTVVINISLIFFFIMIIFNWLLNIPFHLGNGLFGISILTRQREINVPSISLEPATKESQIQDNGINQTTFNKLLDVCSLALTNNAQNNKISSNDNIMLTPTSLNTKGLCMRRSASTGRLPNHSLIDNTMSLDSVLKRRIKPHDGSGDTR